VIVNNDIEIWLLFAPFWILGLGALIGSIWHGVHAAVHHQRAPERGRHHRNRALIALAAFVGLGLLGLGVAAAVGLIVGR
jgi:hypothetical protein